MDKNLIKQELESFLYCQYDKLDPYFAYLLEYILDYECSKGNDPILQANVDQSGIIWINATSSAAYPNLQYCHLKEFVEWLNKTFPDKELKEYLTEQINKRIKTRFELI